VKKRKKQPPTAAAATSGAGVGSSEVADGRGGGKVTARAQLLAAWRAFAADVATAERAASVAQGGFAFAFVEGKLVSALRNGWWLLLDEINLVGPGLYIVLRLLYCIVLYCIVLKFMCMALKVTCTQSTW
jgi:hypothetical protein